MRGCKLKTEKELKTEGRGSFDSKFDRNSKISIVCWLDNRIVQLSSTLAAVEPVTSVRRWDKKQQKHIDVPCPAIVSEYNEHMGGVDLFDMLNSLYRIDNRGPKWYRRVFLWTIGLSVVNSWLLYRRHLKQIEGTEVNIISLL